MVSTYIFVVYNKEILKKTTSKHYYTLLTVFPQIIAGGDCSREGDYLREAIISNIAL